MADKYYAISPFAYVANNPTLFVDPDGKVIRLYSEVSNGPLVNILNSAVGQDIFKTPSVGSMQFLTVRNADISSMSSQQRAFYDLMKSMSSAPETYYVNWKASGNDGDPFYIDDYHSSTIYNENMQNINGSKYWTKGYALYHFFAEQKNMQSKNHELFLRS